MICLLEFGIADVGAAMFAPVFGLEDSQYKLGGFRVACLLWISSIPTL